MSSGRTALLVVVVVGLLVFLALWLVSTILVAASGATPLAILGVCGVPLVIVLALGGVAIYFITARRSRLPGR